MCRSGELWTDFSRMAQTSSPSYTRLDYYTNMAKQMNVVK